ncbi:metallophosphoesterase family protein [Novipirellula artificiosorum]|uniref:metallophosphoesterase family protein n=1 Tax=Novipirellula artificiosorum TaxID=2528016 RepID=UPI0018CD74EA|nr:metallophosphoesterase family protein [Novipirellula artificiosorum]
MKLGILTDIHEHIGPLDAALAHSSSENVDQVIVIGDLFETGEQIEETCQRLADAKVVGVWDNHDYGLCREVDDETLASYSDTVLNFMGSLQP